MCLITTSALKTDAVISSLSETADCFAVLIIVAYGVA